MYPLILCMFEDRIHSDFCSQSCCESFTRKIMPEVPQYFIAESGCALRCTVSPFVQIGRDEVKLQKIGRIFTFLALFREQNPEFFQVPEAI